MISGEYRCPNCLKSGRPGLRFGVEIIGVPVTHGMLMIDLNELNCRLFCLPCLERGIAGLDGAIGLVAEQEETGWRTLK